MFGDNWCSKISVEWMLIDLQFPFSNRALLDNRKRFHSYWCQLFLQGIAHVIVYSATLECSCFAISFISSHYLFLSIILVTLPKSIYLRFCYAPILYVFQTFRLFRQNCIFYLPLASSTFILRCIQPVNVRSWI